MAKPKKSIKIKLGEPNVYWCIFQHNAPTMLVKSQTSILRASTWRQGEPSITY